jgi:transposase
LTAHQRRRLLETLHHTLDAKLYRRLLAIVQLDRGKPATQTAQLLDVGRASIYRWLKRYLRQRDPQAVSDRPGRGRPRLVDAPTQQLLERTLKVPPAQFGYLETGWTLPLLSEHLARVADRTISPLTLRRTLHELDFAFKRPRYRLEPDPEYEKKSEPWSASCASSLAAPPSGRRTRL